MKFTQEQRIKFFIKSLKGLGILGVIALNSYIAYRYVNAEQDGRERAFIRQKQKKQNPKINQEKQSLLPEQLQPEYIEKQRRKYQKIIKSKQNNEDV